MLKPGVYPAAVTPFDGKGRIDLESLAKLLAFFEASGCQGAVLAGTNGEGPSLAAVEKRDLIRDAAPLRGKLDLVLGIATTSLEEAVWTAKRAAEFGAVSVLAMAPFYFKGVSEAAVTDWFLSLMDRSPSPVLVYNFPKYTGVAITGEMMGELGKHPNCAGCKDSSGEADNLGTFRTAMLRPEQTLFVGDERLLIEALEAGWTGTISGASNVMARWMAAIVRDWNDGDAVSAREKFKLAMPAIEAIRASSQPASNKACLYRIGVIQRPDVRLPLVAATAEAAANILEIVETQVGRPIG